MGQFGLKVAFVCLLALVIASGALQTGRATSRFAFDAPQAAEISWSTLTSDQLAQLAPEAFTSLNESTLGSIPDSAIGSISSAQVSKIPASACGGFVEAHFAAMTPQAFSGFTEGCVLAVIPTVWSQISAAKLANMTENAFHGFKNTSWVHIPPDSMSMLHSTQGMYLRHHTCGGFTADQVAKMPPTFLGALVGECLALAPSPCWIGITADGIKAIQSKITHLNLPDVVPEIKPESWSKLTDNFAKVCPYVTAAQMPAFSTKLFEEIPSSCCNSIPVDAWRAVTPAQINVVRLDAFSQDLTYTRIIGLNNKTLAAISPTQWNALGAKHNSTITELRISEIFRIVSQARSRFLNFEPHRHVEYPISFIQSVKSAVDSAHSSLRDQILSAVWPEPDNLGILLEWTWVHSIFMAQGPKSGIVQAHVDYLAAAQPASYGYVPLAGIRRKFIPLFTQDALKALSPGLVQQIQADAFAGFTAPQLDAMGNISAVPAANWASVSPVVMEELSFDTYRKLNASVIESFSCSQATRLDIDRIYEDYNKNPNDPLVQSFKSVLSKCTIWREPVYGLSLRSIILIASGSGCLLLIIIGGVIYWLYRRRNARNNGGSSYRNDADSTPLLDSVRHY